MIVVPGLESRRGALPRLCTAYTGDAARHSRAQPHGGARGRQTPEPPIVAPADDAKVFDPSQSRPVPETTPEGTPSGDVVGDEATMTEEDEKVIADETVQQPGWGNARDQRKSVRVDGERGGLRGDAAADQPDARVPRHRCGE